LFNLGSALAFVQTLPAGVYVAMNGPIFTGTMSGRIKSLAFLKK